MTENSRGHNGIVSNEYTRFVASLGQLKLEATRDSMPCEMREIVTTETLSVLTRHYEA